MAKGHETQQHEEQEELQKQQYEPKGQQKKQAPRNTDWNKFKCRWSVRENWVATR